MKKKKKFFFPKNANLPLVWFAFIGDTTKVEKPLPKKAFLPRPTWKGKKRRPIFPFFPKIIRICYFFFFLPKSALPKKN